MDNKYHQGQPQMGYQQPMEPHYAPAPDKHEAHAHPHNHGSNKWAFGLFDCFSPFGTCCLATWCPCIQYGKTYDRERGDPTSSGINGMCCAYYCLSCFGVACILQFINRGSMREKYGIEGGTFGDFCGACWCSCCQLIQEHKESIVRTQGIDPKTKLQYKAPDAMTYP